MSDHALENTGMQPQKIESRSRKYLGFLIIVAILYDLFDSFVTNVPNVINDLVIADFSITSDQYAFALGIFSCGTFFALVSQSIADRVGRKPMLFVAFLGMGATCFTLALAQNLIQYSIAAFFMYIFFSSDIWTIMVSEDGPKNARARLVTIILTFGAIGSLLTSIFRGLLAGSFGWRGVTWFGIAAIPCAFICLFTKETKAYEILRHRRKRRSILTRIKVIDGELKQLVNVITETDKRLMKSIEKIQIYEAERMSVEDSLRALEDRYKRGEIPSKTAYQKLQSDFLRKIIDIQKNQSKYQSNALEINGSRILFNKVNEIWKKPFQGSYRTRFMGIMTVAFIVGLNYLFITMGLTYLKDERGFTQDQRDIVVFIMTISAVIGFLVTGVLADKVGRKVSFYLFTSIMITGIFVTLFGSGDLVYVGIFLFGMSIWGSAILSRVLCMECFPTDIRGASAGWRTLFFAAGSSAGAFIASALIPLIKLSGVFFVYSLILVITIPLIWRCVSETRGCKLEEVT